MNSDLYIVHILAAIAATEVELKHAFITFDYNIYTIGNELYYLGYLNNLLNNR